MEVNNETDQKTVLEHHAANASAFHHRQAPPSLLVAILSVWHVIAEMRFNLACYACQLGKLEEAMMWLEKAMAMAGKKEICGMALADSDLKPLWDKIREI